MHREAFIRLEVVDTGLGIAPDEIGRIFEEFHQLGGGTKRPEGLGLGLSIVKRTAELLGCDLDVNSKPGEGSVFSVVVPQGHSAGVALSEATTTSNPELTTGLIVVVDDEPAVLDATAMFLMLEDFEVLTASSQSEAIERLSGRTPDLLITDYHLRDEKTGIEVIRSIRDQATIDIPVILVSGDTSDAIVVKDLKDVSFLSKPVNADELLSEVRRQMSDAT